eukprot:13821717-Alexandrium_andersonii.AAC.1
MGRGRGAAPAAGAIVDVLVVRHTPHEAEHHGLQVVQGSALAGLAAVAAGLQPAGDGQEGGRRSGASGASRSAGHHADPGGRATDGCLHGA